MIWIVTRNYVIYSASFIKGGGGNKEVGSAANHRDVYTVEGYKAK